MLGRILGSWSCCGSLSQVLSTSVWRGLHFQYSGAEISSFGGLGLSFQARAARIFFKDFDVVASRNPKFRSPVGAFRSCLAPSSLILGRILGS